MALSENVDHFLNRFKDKTHVGVKGYNGDVIFTLNDDDLSDYDNGNVYTRSFFLPYEVFDISKVVGTEMDEEQHMISFFWKCESSNTNLGLTYSNLDGFCYNISSEKGEWKIIVGWNVFARCAFFDDFVYVVSSRTNNVLKEMFDQIKQYHFDYLKRG